MRNFFQPNFQSSKEFKDQAPCQTRKRARLATAFVPQVKENKQIIMLRINIFFFGCVRINILV